MTGPRNPSELQRLEEEAEVDKKNDQIVESWNILRVLEDSYVSKSTKEGLLHRLRELEKALGVESTPYNDTNFIERSRDALLYLRRRIN